MLLRRSLPPLLVLLLAIPGAAPAPAIGAGSGPSAAELLDRAIRLADRARAEVLTEDRCPFSPAGVVLRTGADPEALAAFVRERILWEPCLGVVRGPAGTLAAGAGGDWDRAVLLRALLAEAGFASKLRVVPRSEAERAAAVAGFLAGPVRERTLGAAGSAEPVALAPAADFLAEAGLSLPGREMDAARGAARWRTLREEALDATADAAPALEAAVASAPDPFAAARKALLAAAAERVVVVAGDRVLDLGPDGAAPAGGRLLDAPPADRVASFGVALRMQVAGPGAPAAPKDLLNRTFHLADLYGRAMRFQIAPDGSATGDTPPDEWTPAEWARQLAAFEKFQAFLEVGRLWLASEAFDLAGRTFKVGGDGRIEGASDLGAATSRGFGGFGGFGGGGEEAAPEKPKTRIAALTLELRVDLPGAAPAIAKRLLYGDLRPGTSPIVHSDLVVFGGPSGPDSALWRAVDTGTANARFRARILGAPDPRRMLRTDDMRMFHSMLEDWQLARLGVADRLLAADPGLTFAGGPAVAAKTAYLIPDAAAGEVRMRTVVDVVRDDLVILPREAEAAARAFRANLRLGVASTVLESCLVREQRPTATVRGAYAVFAAAAARGERPVAGRRDGFGAAEPAPLSRWALEQEAPDAVLVFPGAGAVSTWWSVDPGTGRTLGRGDGGEGQSLAEYKAAIKAAFTNLKCMVGVLQGMGQGKSASGNAYEWGKCITGFDPAKPSSYVGAAGSYQNATMGLEALSKLADVLGGVESLMEMAEKKGGR